MIALLVIGIVFAVVGAIQSPDFNGIDLVAVVAVASLIAKQLAKVVTR